MYTTNTLPKFATPVQQQQHAHLPAAGGVEAQHIPPGQAPTGTPGITIPTQQAALPTEEQMRNPYNVQTDPTRAGSPEQHFQEQRAINPAEQGARLAQARVDTELRMAQERAQFLEQQLQNNQAQNQQQITALQQQMAANAAPPVDPLAQYELTPEERELAGDQLGVVQKIAERMARASAISTNADVERRMAEMQANFDSQLAPIQQASQQTAEQIQRDWGNAFVNNVQTELGFDVRALQGDPAWEAFATRVIPHSGGLTYGAQLGNFIKTRDTASAMEITRSFAAERTAQSQAVMNPTAQTPTPQQPDTRASAFTPPAADPAAQQLADTQEYTRLTDQLSRGTLSIPDFHRLTKPINDRLAGLKT